MRRFLEAIGDAGNRWGREHAKREERAGVRVASRYVYRAYAKRVILRTLAVWSPAIGRGISDLSVAPFSKMAERGFLEEPGEDL